MGIFEEHQKRVEQFPAEIQLAHKHSTMHRTDIETSDRCGCFYCCSVFQPTEIQEWCDENEVGLGQTALCPKCGIDSVIGSNSGVEITPDFLNSMKDYWF